MREPRWEAPRFTADFRAVAPVIQRFPDGCDEHYRAFDELLRAVGDLHYEGFIRSPKNSYQVNPDFDQRLVAKLCSSNLACDSEPELKVPREIARAVGKKADMLLHIPEPSTRIVVEAEKSNKEKILRDIVKMLLFLDSAQADVAALICPTNYVHRKGVWRAFDTAGQVLRSFIRVTCLPKEKAQRIALLGFTQQIFINGRWASWDKNTRSQLVENAKPHVDRPAEPPEM